jgi:flagellar basal body-associated protein FliL
MDQQPEAVEVPTPPAPPKKGGGKVLLILVTVVLVGGAAVAGATLGPKLLHPPAPAAAAEGEAEGGDEHGTEAAPEEEEEAESHEAPASKAAPTTSAAFSPIVVDIRGGEGELHHLKVVLSFELAEKFTEEDFKKWTPRGREAALTYLRTLDYEGATDVKRFDAIRKELCDRVKAALGGKKNIRRVLVTDFVAQ